ncbi:MAG TPA: acyl-CoA thioesterase [Herpetosiphonaceae bacterium]|nr:acyl-CoA thioesterase [Herpetosiphonaceae bacterium]
MPNQRRALTLRFLAEPINVNYGGKVHGGTVMKWIDQAGYACAVGWSGQYCVTVYVGGIRFYHPILITNIVEARAKVIHTGTTSMHIAVDIYAGDPKDGPVTKTTHCIIIFVAVDEAGKPVAVPAWQPESAEDIALDAYARRLMELRQQIDAEMKAYL